MKYEYFLYDILAGARKLNIFLFDGLIDHEEDHFAGFLVDRSVRLSKGLEIGRWMVQ